MSDEIGRVQGGMAVSDSEPQPLGLNTRMTEPDFEILRCFGFAQETLRNVPLHDFSLSYKQSLVFFYHLRRFVNMK